MSTNKPDGVEAYPLSWPEGWKRTKRRTTAKFKTGFGAARNFLFDELRRMGAAKAIVSTNVPLKIDGRPRANMAPDGGDSGVAVYFEREGKYMVFACDKYIRTEANIHAIAKTIEALRGIERWGASDMMERAFSGFKQLAAENFGDSWWTALGVDASAPLDVIELNYRRQARVCHPDNRETGSHKAMQRLNLALEQAKAVRRGGSNVS